MDRALARTLLHLVSCCALWLIVGPSYGEEADRLTSERLDDAELTAVTFLDEQRGWAVGDRGAIWQTIDGGRNWKVQIAPSDCRWEDVVFVDEKNGWIAGGRVEPGTFKTTGVVLRTRDGGQNWMQLPSPTLPGLRRIAFTDDRRGWTIATASAMYPTGILETEDGGRSWSPRPGRTGQAWLAGDFFRGGDGGATGARPAGAAGSGPTNDAASDAAVRRSARRGRKGLAAGADGKLAIVAADELLEVAIPDTTPARAVRQIRCDESGKCWLIGDRGLVLCSSDGGLQWQAPVGAIPAGVAQCDFTALATRGDRCWIAGAPGTWILTTADGGATWEVQSTGQSLPLRALHFADDQHGWGVGALGTILATRDGGRTWRRQHGGQRLAILAIVSEAEAVPFELFAQLCGNDGYRGGALVVYRRDVETPSATEAPDEQRLQAAVVAAGGSTSVWARRFPVRQKGLPLAAERHLEGWREGDETPDKTLERYVADQIRIWRPDLIVTDDVDGASDASLAGLTQRTVMSAVNRAAAPESADARPIPGLAAWQVKKIFSSLPGSERGTIRLPAAQLASRLGRSLGDAALLSRELAGIHEPSPAQHGFRLLMSQLPQDAGRRDFFGGLTLAPGSESRRGATGLGKGDLAALQRSAQQQRNVQQLLVRGGENARGAAWLAQFDELTNGLSAEHASDVAWQLTLRYDRAGHHEQAAAALALIAQKYGASRWGDAAIAELVRRQSSGELAHWRRRAAQIAATANGGDDESNGGVSTAGAAAPDGDATAVKRLPPALRGATPQPGAPPLFVEIPAPPPRRSPSRIAAAAALAAIDDEVRAPQPAARISATDRAELEPDSLATEEGATPAAETTTSGDPREASVAKLAAWLERNRPWLFAEPAIKASLAGATSRQGRARDVQQWWRTLAPRARDDGWAQIARQELALLDAVDSDKSKSRAMPDERIARCATCDEPPKLDGKLDETFWQEATPVRLSSQLLDDEAWPAGVLVARDAENLYLAVSCMKAVGVDYSAPAGARPRDPDSTGRDRVELFLDIDRDYASAYHLTIDSRGWVSERCLGDARWNPTWFVAAREDAESWTVEAAIPWKELVAAPPAESDAWAFGAQRVVPGVGFQSWTRPAAIVGRPDGWGLLRFEAQP